VVCKDFGRKTLCKRNQRGDTGKYILRRVFIKLGGREGKGGKLEEVKDK